MIAFPEMLVSAAAKAGIPVPPDVRNFDDKDFPLFHLFCSAQLGNPMPSMGCHWENAHVIASVPADKVHTITFAQLEKMGFQIGLPIP